MQIILWRLFTHLIGLTLFITHFVTYMSPDSHVMLWSNFDSRFNPNVNQLMGTPTKIDNYTYFIQIDPSQTIFSCSKTKSFLFRIVSNMFNFKLTDSKWGHFGHTQFDHHNKLILHSDFTIESSYLVQNFNLFFLWWTMYSSDWRFHA